MEEIMKKAGTEEAVASAVALHDHSHSRRSFTRPSWLLFTVADLDEKMRLLLQNTPNENNNVNANDATFAERAEAYYLQRPQLLALLQDLYNNYLSLADRYCQTLAKNHHRRHSSNSALPFPPIQFEENTHFYDQEGGNTGDIDSDAESSLSYQPMSMSTSHVQTQTKVLDSDMVVAELVMKTVDYEIFVHEHSLVERRCNESSTKLDLQKSLLEILESERLILLNENARLGYQVRALIDENKGLASESLFMKRKAGELARCVLKMREDHRVCLLTRKIEDLQGHIYGLEKRNKEYYDQLVKHQGEKNKKKKAKSRSGRGGGSSGVILEDCFRVDEEEVRPNTSRIGNVLKEGGGGSGSGSGRVSKLWERVKNFDLLLCGPHFDSTSY